MHPLGLKLLARRALDAERNACSLDDIPVMQEAARDYAAAHLQIEAAAATPSELALVRRVVMAARFWVMQRGSPEEFTAILAAAFGVNEERRNMGAEFDDLMRAVAHHRIEEALH